MRSPVDVPYRILALGLSAALAGCGIVGGGADRPPELAVAPAASGPAADYPMVLGEPFAVAGELYTPSDAMNYDAVGYAVADPQGGPGVTVSHKTLPLPSYVELTSLDSGKTILARVERRGPMSSALVALSPGAQAQLGATASTAVRVRRVNPPEAERAELRAGRPAPDRLDTPKALADVLRRKLPAGGEANVPNAVVAAAPAVRPVTPQVMPSAKRTPAAAPSAVAPRIASRPAPAAVPASAEQSADAAPAARRVVTAYPLKQLGGLKQTASAAPVAARAAAPATGPTRAPEAVGAADGFVVQAAAFSSKANAERAAGRLGGFVTPAGRYFRVRTGPYQTRGQADAALAKVRAAGYSDAKVFTSG